MSEPSTGHRSFRVGDWVVDPASNRIARGTRNGYLRPQVMELLVYLAGRPGRVVSANELLDRLWANKVVASGSVYGCVAELRQALADGSDESTYLETIPKKGYRLLAPVSGFDDGAPAGGERKARWPLAAGAAATLLVILAAGAWFTLPAARDRHEAAKPDTRSIAVMPFANESADGEDAEFLAFGIHDDLLTLLSQVEGLRVIANRSVRQFGNADRDVPEIGAALGVDRVLTGSVRRAGDQVRLNVRLIDAGSGEQLWSGQYDREVSASDIFALQSEMVGRITTELETALTSGARSRLAAVPTRNTEAYEAYQLGKLRLYEFTVPSMAAARAYFERAISLDPGFARAYVELVNCYLAMQDYGNMPLDEVIRRSDELLKSALELNPQLGEAYAAAAKVKLLKLVDGQAASPGDAEADFQRAVALSPSYLPARHLYGQYLAFNGRFAESREQFEAAVGLSPLSPGLHMGFGQMLGLAGHNDEALLQLGKALEIDPAFVPAQQQLSYLYAENLGQLDQAILHARQAAALDPESPDNAEQLTFRYLDLGDAALAEKWAVRAAAVDPKLGTMPLIARDNREAILALIQRNLDGDPNDSPHVDNMLHAWTSARYLLAEGRFADARSLLERSDPPWFRGPLPAVDWTNDRDGATVAYVLQETGDTERAARLFERILAWQRGARRTGARGYQFADAMIYAVQGRKDKAVAALIQAYEDGQRSGYWELRARLVPGLVALEGNPGFERIAARFESDYATQLAHVREMQRQQGLPAVPQAAR